MKSATNKLALLGLLALQTVGCNQKKEPIFTSANKVTGPSVVGQWKSVATNGRPMDVTIDMREDKTFTFTVVTGDGRKSVQTGTYKTGTREVASVGKFTTVDMTATMNDGRPAPPGSTVRFVYDPVHDTFGDILSLGLVRADKAEAVKKQMEAEAKSNHGNR